RLASAVVAGHIIECGTQCTGGNYAFFEEVPQLAHPGFPLVELREDGSFVVTKHPGTQGLVSVGTVTAQLLYEIEGPAYANPDVTARFDTLALRQEGPDRVAVSGVRGAPPPPHTKVCINHTGGFKNSVTFVLTGLDIEAKAALAERTFWELVGGREQFAQTHVSLRRGDQADPTSNEAAFAHLTLSVRDPDAEKVGRAFTNKAVEMALASYPGCFLTAPPGRGSPVAVYWPTLIPREVVEQRVAIDGDALPVPCPPAPAAPPSPSAAPADPGPAPGGPTRDAPLGRICGARSGDKGGNANVGVWVCSDPAWRWLFHFLDVERFRALVPEARELAVDRYAFPNLRALNFVVRGLLGDGVAASLRADPQAKSLGEYLRARRVPVPAALLEG
ncbi:MAG TPA: acyclic terpene utilization AtuA family protein, partial [Myxococcota bacterium]